ncbi:uncharacterized protein LOC129408224 [Boleophthalmus pectinirostris]|uniref:uncharacterized protein LOC129408224 n=1 Tax=Boleophthalmus pectinirostris TaxID=150288 RepID=UPI00242A89B1|nr:uncharacterized protein LOC129408224 [Boleophthalmus pectinirostris]
MREGTKGPEVNRGGRLHRPQARYPSMRVVCREFGLPYLAPTRPYWTPGAAWMGCFTTTLPKHSEVPRNLWLPSSPWELNVTGGEQFIKIQSERCIVRSEGGNELIGYSQIGGTWWQCPTMHPDLAGTIFQHPVIKKPTTDVCNEVWLYKACKWRYYGGFGEPDYCTSAHPDYNGIIWSDTQAMQENSPELLSMLRTSNYNSIAAYNRQFGTGNRRYMLNECIVQYTCTQLVKIANEAMAQIASQCFNGWAAYFCPEIFYPRTMDPNLLAPARMEEEGPKSAAHNIQNIPPSTSSWDTRQNLHRGMS